MALPRSSFLAAGVLASALLTSSFAFAADTAAAQALFSDARKLMAKGDFSSACPKLEESQRLDPGMGTLFNLGDCYEHVGRTASAWAAFDEVAAAAHIAGQAGREQDARTRAAKLLTVMPHLTVDASAVRGYAGLEIKRDGVVIGPPQWGSAIPIDPGDHTLAASADGKQPWSGKVTVLPKQNQRAKIPALVDAPKPVEAALPQEEQPKTIILAPPAAPQRDGKTQRTVGLALAGVGVVGLGVGVAFGLVSKGKESEANDGDCDATTNICKTQAGVDARHAATVDGTIASVGLIAGAVLAVGGVVLWATAPRSHAAPTIGSLRVAPDASFGQHGASLGLRGNF